MTTSITPDEVDLVRMAARLLADECHGGYHEWVIVSGAREWSDIRASVWTALVRRSRYSADRCEADAANITRSLRAAALELRL